jgi:hypothetical protein
MDMSSQHQQVDADLRGEYADLLQAGERATETVVQGLFADDQLQVGSLLIGAYRYINVVVRAETASQELPLH